MARARAVLLLKLRYFAKRTLNPLVLRVAGSRFMPFGVLYHRGRRSGRTYAVPLLPTLTGDIFVFSVTHGTATDWYRNVLAAGTSDFRWRGMVVRLEGPVPLPPKKGLSAFNPLERVVLRVVGVQTFLAMKKMQGTGQTRRAQAELKEGATKE